MITYLTKRPESTGVDKERRFNFTTQDIPFIDFFVIKIKPTHSVITFRQGPT